MITPHQFPKNPEYEARPDLPGASVSLDILVPQSLDNAVVDTVQLADPGLAPSVTLTETGVDTGLFVSEFGHVFVLKKDYVLTTQVDSMPCLLVLPGGALALEDCTGQALATETSPASSRFRCTQEISARPQPSLRHDILDSVTVLPAPGENEGWFPIAASCGLADGLSLSFLGRQFAFEGHATTAPSKPFVGFVIRSGPEPTEEEMEDLTAPLPAKHLEFVYFDHATSALTRIPLAEGIVQCPYSVKLNGSDYPAGSLPLREIAFVTADGSPSDGIIPLPIETLLYILQGGTPILDAEQYAYIELRGHIDGEVVRFGNEDGPRDFFDLVAGDAETLLQEDACHVRLQKLADRRFRTSQKVVIYSTREEEDSPQALTTSQWLALRAAGYLAIHNPPKKVFWGTEDIEWLEKERGSFHPPAGMKMGVGGVTDATKEKFYRYEGFDDHHLFNKYHAANGQGKALAWSKLFEGQGFDVDEYTVPVRKKVHSKIQHLANKGWKSFLEEVFDETTGQLKPHITGRVLAQKRGEAFALMHTLASQMGLKLHWCRPYPLEAITRGPKSHLYQVLVNSRSHLGASLNRLGDLSTRFLKVLGPEWEEWGMMLFRKHVKAFAKAAGKACLHCLPLIFSIQTHQAAHEMLIYTAAYSDIVIGFGHWLNSTLELEDLPLAIELAKGIKGLLKDLTAGEVLVAQLPSGASIQKGSPNFECLWDASGKIVHVTPYVITKILRYPSGRIKVESTMVVEPYQVRMVEDFEWIIQDWYPAPGDTMNVTD